MNHISYIDGNICTEVKCNLIFLQKIIDLKSNLHPKVEKRLEISRNKW